MESSDILSRYKTIFPYESFNSIQVNSFDDIFNNNKSVIVKAPTGSGKTVIFEFGILKLIFSGIIKSTNCKIIYTSPLRSLCRERFIDWENKFQEYDLKGVNLAGDQDNILSLQNYHILYVTPEKLDYITRRRDLYSLNFEDIHLFCIDEIHTLNDGLRGATFEVVITRLKHLCSDHVRFIAVSATINNLEDVSQWLSSKSSPCICHKMDNKLRIVKLEKIVRSFPRQTSQSLFQFDNILNHKIPDIITQYSQGKPVLIFCITRKSTVNLAGFLVEQTKFQLDVDNLQQLVTISTSIQDHKLRSYVICGVGFHHAGLSNDDRQLVESAFLCGALPVLCSTSTLAMGVNLPAHLVIVKGTTNFNLGGEEMYTQNKLLQMIGRAGRPKFDTSGVAVVITETEDESRIRNLLMKASEAVESQLFHNLDGHLNAEITIGILTQLTSVIDWIRNTFLIVRCHRNPSYYNFPANSSKEMIEQKLNEKVLQTIELLKQNKMIEINQNNEIISTKIGRLMCSYNLSLTTMHMIRTLSDYETIEHLLLLLSNCEELTEISLRYNERTAINILNRQKGPNKLRFPLKERLTTTSQKIICLIQVNLARIKIPESTFVLDSEKIFKIMSRIIKCMYDYLMFDLSTTSSNYQTIISCTLLRKSISAQLWDNSWLVSIQLPSVGLVLSEHLTASGYNTIKSIACADPSTINTLLKKSVPFGEKLVEAAGAFPRYELIVEQEEMLENKCYLNLTVLRTRQKPDNSQNNDVASCFEHDAMCLVIGDYDNNLIYKTRISNKNVCNGNRWSAKVKIEKLCKQADLKIDLISENYVGFDIRIEYEPCYLDVRPSTSSYMANSVVPPNTLNYTAEKKISKSNTNKRNSLKEALEASSHCYIDNCSSQYVTPVTKKPKIFSWKTCQSISSQRSNSQRSKSSLSHPYMLSYGVTDQNVDYSPITHVNKESYNDQNQYADANHGEDNNTNDIISSPDHNFSRSSTPSTSSQISMKSSKTQFTFRKLNSTPSQSIGQIKNTLKSIIVDKSTKFLITPQLSNQSMKQNTDLAKCSQFAYNKINNAITSNECVDLNTENTQFLVSPRSSNQSIKRNTVLTECSQIAFNKINNSITSNECVDLDTENTQFLVSPRSSNQSIKRNTALTECSQLKINNEITSNEYVDLDTENVPDKSQLTNSGDPNVYITPYTNILRMSETNYAHKNQHNFNGSSSDFVNYNNKFVSDSIQQNTDEYSSQTKLYNLTESVDYDEGWDDLFEFIRITNIIEETLNNPFQING